MGKPFLKEIEEIPNTISWALKQPVDEITEFFNNNPNTPLFIVGSGGSLSACYLAAYLYQKTGTIAKAITPLELYYSKEALNNSKILFLSSSGKNNDILFSFDIAIKQEPKSILAFCMKRDNPLSKATSNYTISKSVEYDIPTKKDGFLATNTLVAYYIMLCRAFKSNPLLLVERIVNLDYSNQVNEFVGRLSPSHSLTVLYGGVGQSVAYDIESKFTESALGNISLCDYRNFGHGRHHWFAKREMSSAIIALITPEEKQLAEKTLNFIPSSIPKFIIESKNESSFSSIELLVKSFQLAASFGQMLNIDPGRPGVPDFGKKLYHLKYSTFYKIPYEKNSFEKELHIKRKIGVSSLTELSEEQNKFWFDRYKDFLQNLRSTSFGIIIFDYDGTICPIESRFIGVPTEIREELVRLLNGGIIIGVATGRGKSVRDIFNQWVPENLKGNVIIGYYNGSDIGSLNDLNIPNKNILVCQLLKKLEEEVIDLKSSIPVVRVELRPKQLTIYFNETKSNERVIDLIRLIVQKPEFSSLEMLESSHSIDIIKRPDVSKLNIITECTRRAIVNNKSTQYLCIGDKGKWPGNDFELLSSPFSLSVEQVSSDPDTCWNLSSIGLKNADATLEYLKRISIMNGNVIFQ